jgi:hypothetical protein
MQCEHAENAPSLSETRRKTFRDGLLDEAIPAQRRVRFELRAQNVEQPETIQDDADGRSRVGDAQPAIRRCDHVVRPHQLANPRGVNRGHPGEAQRDAPRSALQQRLNRVPQLGSERSMQRTFEDQ